jgi:hypothetical protein
MVFNYVDFYLNLKKRCGDLELDVTRNELLKNDFRVAIMQKLYKKVFDPDKVADHQIYSAIGKAIFFVYSGDDSVKLYNIFWLMLILNNTNNFKPEDEKVNRAAGSIEKQIHSYIIKYTKLYHLQDSSKKPHGGLIKYLRANINKCKKKNEIKNIIKTKWNKVVMNSKHFILLSKSISNAFQYIYDVFGVEYPLEEANKHIQNIKYRIKNKTIDDIKLYITQNKLKLQVDMENYTVFESPFCDIASIDNKIIDLINDDERIMIFKKMENCFSEVDDPSLEDFELEEL